MQRGLASLKGKYPFSKGLARLLNLHHFNLHHLRCFALLFATYWFFLISFMCPILVRLV